MKTLTRADVDGMKCEAVFSDDETCRLELIWRWSDSPLLVVWMLNPSTATHEVLDPTVFGLIKRARQWGYGGVRIINLFALRATKPEVMLAHPSPIGADNDLITRKVLRAAADDGAPVICAWGRHGRHLGREAWAIKLAAELGVALFVFRLNQDGTPQHPLYYDYRLHSELMAQFNHLESTRGLRCALCEADNPMRWRSQGEAHMLDWSRGRFDEPWLRELWNRDDAPDCRWLGVCVMIERVSALEVDHVVPLWKVALMPREVRRPFFGPEYLQLLCSKCHKAKTAEEAAERAQIRALARAAAGCPPT